MIYRPFLLLIESIEVNRLTAQVDNLWELKHEDRISYIRTKFAILKREAQENIQTLLEEYRQSCGESEDANNSVKVEGILKKADIIGLTITGINSTIKIKVRTN